MEFTQRHREWNEGKDRDEMLEEIMVCMRMAQKDMIVDVSGNVIRAKAEPEHFVEDLLAEFLAKQFRDYYIILESSRGTFVAGKNVAGVVKSTVEPKLLVKKLDSSGSIDTQQTK